jgi:predicted transcriptional regulator
MVTGTRQIHVRVSPATHRLLQELSADTGDPMSAIVDRAVEQYRRAQIFAAAEREYRKLESDPQALAEYEAEIALWDVTAGDDLEREEW